MSGLGLVFAFLAIAFVAVLVSGSVTAGLVIAALEFVFWGLTRYIKGLRHQHQ